MGQPPSSAGGVHPTSIVVLVESILNGEGTPVGAMQALNCYSVVFELAPLKLVADNLNLYRSPV
jgi:hypothetical protein